MVTIAAGGGFGGKPRPALVIQSDQFAELTTVLVAPFTSVLADPPTIRPRFSPDAGNGLRTISDLMVDILIAMRTPQIGSVVGRLAREDMARAERALLVILGFAE